MTKPASITLAIAARVQRARLAYAYRAFNANPTRDCALLLQRTLRAAWGVA